VRAGTTVPLAALAAPDGGGLRWRAPAGTGAGDGITPPRPLAAAPPAPRGGGRARIAATLLGAVLLGVVAGGVLVLNGRGDTTGLIRDPGPSAAPAVTAAPGVVATAPAAAPAPAPTPEPAPSPSPSPTPTPSPSPAGELVGVQQRLTELGYYAGPLDGADSSATRSAVMAFQKVQGLAPDGVAGPATLGALEDPVLPQLRGGEPDRVEVDLSIQVLYLVEGGEVARILPVSSGNGETYRQADGDTAVALTPVGTFRVERRIRGERVAPLGSLYDPLYFYKGWAIHGSNSVPASEASHGCVRVPRADAVWLFDRIPVGTQVVLYGGTHAFTLDEAASAGTDTPGGDTPQDAPVEPAAEAPATQAPVSELPAAPSPSPSATPTIA